MPERHPAIKRTSRRRTSHNPLPPVKSQPGDRSRHRLTPAEAKELACYARHALKLKRTKVQRRGEKGDRFKDLQDESGMRHETLLKWAVVAEAFGADLEKYLMELGKTKLYVLAYHPEPRAALNEEVVDRQGRTMTGRSVDAESLRLHIRAKYPDKRRGSWFRKHAQRPFTASLKRALSWLEDDVQRAAHKAQSGLKPGERAALVRFRKRLKKLASDITAALDSAPDA